MPEPLQYRPRTVTELVDAAVRLYRRDFVTYTLLAAIAYLPFLIVMMIVTSTSDTPSPLLSGGIALLGWVGYSALDGTVLSLGGSAYLGEPMDTGQAFSRALRHLPGIMGAAIVRGVLVLVGFVLLIIPGLIMYVKYAVTNPAILVEDIGGSAGMKRSATLTQGSKRHVMNAMGLVWLLYYVLSIAITMVFVVTRNPLLQQVLSGVITVFAYPVVSLTALVVYFDLRIRKEGLDLELMSRALDTSRVPSPSRPMSSTGA